MFAPSRRELLTAGASAALLPLTRWADTLAPEEGFRFAFFSDTHVGLKSNIEENRRMLAEIAAWNPAFAINGGDVTDYGWVAEYQNYQGLIANLPFRIHHNPGNHDVRWSPLGPKAFREGTRGPLYSSFDHQGVHFVILDSTVPLSHYGHFESEMLRWLEADLKRYGQQTPVIIATHHWVGRDRLITDNEQALLKVIEPYNVKLILNGHGHSDLLWTWDGITNTMNKGLYQGSWQRIEVDRLRGEVRLLRRSGDAPEPKLLTAVPLRAEQAKRQIHALGAVGTELRLGEGTWLPNSAETVAKLPPGEYRLAYRKDPNTYFSGERHVVAGGRLKEVWRTPLSGGVMSHLNLQAGTLYLSSMDGSVRALDAASGRVKWAAKTQGYCHSSPVVADDLVIVGSADGWVYAFDRRTGESVWRYRTQGPVYASAAVAGDVVVIASGDGFVYGLDMKIGARRWRYTMPPSNTAFVQSPAVSDGERVFLGAWDRFFYALDAASGELAWRAQCTEKSFAYSPAIGQPILAESCVVVPSNDNQLHAFDGKTGAVVWKLTAPGDKFGYPSPAYLDGVIYVGGLGDRGQFHAVSLATGKILWSAETGETIYDSGAAVGSEFVATGSVSGRLSVMDRKTGALLAQRQLPPGLFLSTCAVEGRRIFAATYNDTAIALDLEH